MDPVLKITWALLRRPWFYIAAVLMSLSTLLGLFIKQNQAAVFLALGASLLSMLSFIGILAMGCIQVRELRDEFVVRYEKINAWDIFLSLLFFNVVFGLLIVGISIIPFSVLTALFLPNLKGIIAHPEGAFPFAMSPAMLPLLFIGIFYVIATSSVNSCGTGLVIARGRSEGAVRGAFRYFKFVWAEALILTFLLLIAGFSSMLLGFVSERIVSLKSVVPFAQTAFAMVLYAVRVAGYVYLAKLLRERVPENGARPPESSQNS